MSDEPLAPAADIEDFHPGAEVWSTDDHKVGKLHEIVVDTSTNTIARIVVNAGPHFPIPGFGAPKLVSVPIEEVLESTEEKVLLRCFEYSFDRFPRYADWLASLGGRYSLGSAWKVRHRSQFEREISRGARVWRSEPHLYLGNVERILMEDETDMILSLVIGRGPLFDRDMVLPIDFVTDYADEIIHVQMTDAEIESLQEFIPSED